MREMERLEAFPCCHVCWSVLGETAWSMVSSDLSRRGFSGWLTEILILNMEVLGLGICPPSEANFLNF